MKTREQRKADRKRNARINWMQWIGRNPVIVIENGVVRTFRLDDMKFFQPGVYPGLQRARLPKFVPEEMPQVVKFDDEGVMVQHA